VTPKANQAQHDAWNGDSGHRWVADADRRDRVMAPVAEALRVAAAVVAGEAVLDIGCGCGATTLDAARTVAVDGSVLGLDLSEPMLAVARQRVDAAGLGHVTLRQADAQTHPFAPGTHDAAISRFGTMFFDAPVAAFTNIVSSLRPEGRLCIATWQPLTANDWLTIPGAALLRYGSLPEATSAPGMFAQSDPTTIADVLEQAGMRDIDIGSVTITLPLGEDPQQATDYLAETGIGRAILDTIPRPNRPGALAAVAEALDDHADHNGVRLNAAIWITTAMRN